MKYLHPRWGEVIVLQAFSSHVNINTTQGIKQCFPTELKELPSNAPTTTTNGIANPPLPTAPMPPVELAPPPQPQLYQINTGNPNTLSRAFRPQLTKLVCQRLIERLPFVDAEDFVDRTRDLFENEDLASNLADRLDFTLPPSSTEQEEETGNAN